MDNGFSHLLASPAGTSVAAAIAAIPTTPGPAAPGEEDAPEENGEGEDLTSFTNDLHQLVRDNKDDMDTLAKRAREAPSGSAGDKDKSLFVSTWLLDNYELCDDSNTIPRQDLYDHYKRFAESHDVAPMNAAGFGKLMRGVFPDLKTRRLGTRGSSKYHYCGICLKVKQPSYEQMMQQMSSNPYLNIGMMLSGNVPVDAAAAGQASDTATASATANHAVPDAQRVRVDLPPFPAVSEAFIPHDSSKEEVEAFLGRYRTHCDAILKCISFMRFNDVDAAIRTFWHSQVTEEHKRIVQTPELIELIWRCDSILYDTIMTVLLPNVLQLLPITVIQAIRFFARGLENWIMAAMEQYHPMLITRKIEVAKVFGGQLKRHTSLNHLAQAAVSVLENHDQAQGMLFEWGKVDFEGLRDQAGWVTECRKMDVIQFLEVDIKGLLASASKLEHWTQWIDSVVLRFLDEKLDPTRYIFQARQFLMKWSFYGLLLMREISLRSLSTFGSFHILRLFLDEYLFYIIEQRIAHVQSAGAMPGLTGAAPVANAAHAGDMAMGLHGPMGSMAGGMMAPMGLGGMGMMPGLGMNMNMGMGMGMGMMGPMGMGLGIPGMGGVIGFPAVAEQDQQQQPGQQHSPTQDQRLQDEQQQQQQQQHSEEHEMSL
ncbi:hypothetical protein RI367_003109 [Sorochytrium milnesiophthora]